MNDLLYALQFLTRLPVRPRGPCPDPAGEGRLVLYYPLAGLVIGTLLCLAWLPMANLPPGLSAALLLSSWVGVSGALHLDGLADLADAWVGGQGDRERTLAILKDPRSGPMAVVLVVLVLLVKFAALEVLLGEARWTALLLVPMLGRGGLVAALRFLPYVRPQGIGARQAAHLPRARADRILLAGALLTLLVWGWAALPLLLALVAAFLLLRQALIRRLGGITGDAAGALCELLETVALVVLALHW